MKKIYIAMAVLATVALTSCEQEQSFDDLTPLGENDIAFYIPGPNSTRAAEAFTEAENGITIPVGNDNEGNPLFLEETIEYLNPSPATRGIPAYTENVGKLYTTMGVYAKNSGEGTYSGDATFKVIDDTMTDHPEVGKGWRYRYWYDGKFDPWVDETTKADFYLRMPASQTGVSNLEYAKETKGTIDFDYGSSLTGEDQEDILFAYTSINKETHDDYLPQGAPVLMYHALAGVKFRVGNDNTGTTKTIITKVEFTGLYGSGHCTITPSEDGKGTVEWGNLGTNGVTFTQTFDNPTYTPATGAGNSDGTVDYVKPTTGVAPFGDSWYAGKTGIPGDSNKAADNNLNKEDGSLTFWFIPQAMTKDVVLTVTFCIKTPDTAGDNGGGEITHTINFGEQLAAKNVEWKAGELRTYTLEPTDVDVAIFDTMEGLTKNGLHVTNTGNVDEYVRMLLVGNWYGWLPGQDPNTDEPSILVGYKTDGSGGEDDNELVDYWDYRDTDKEWGSYFDKTFKYGVISAADSKWKRGDGAYYYTDPIGAGTVLDSGTDVLFESYTLPDGKVPDIYIPTITSNVREKAIGVHLVMEVVVQAIPTTKEDGSAFENCWEAWSTVTGTEIGPKN